MPFTASTSTAFSPSRSPISRDADIEAQDSLGFLSVEASKVLHVCPTDAAWPAGLRMGDEVVSINETSFKDRAALVKFVGTLKAGDPLNVAIRRNGEQKLITWGFEAAHADGEALQKIVERSLAGRDLAKISAWPAPMREVVPMKSACEAATSSLTSTVAS